MDIGTVSRAFDSLFDQGYDGTQGAAGAADLGQEFDSYFKDTYGYSSNGLLGKISNFFTGNISDLRNTYEQRYNQNQQAKQQQYEYELARALRSTEYQDAIRDIQAAGLNPYVMLSGGQFGPASQGYSTSTSALKMSKNSDTNVKGFAAILYLIGRVVAAAIGKK